MTEEKERYLHDSNPLGQQGDNSAWRQQSEVEDQIKAATKERIDSLQRQIALVQRIMPLKHSPGFKEFESTVQDCLDHAQNEMVNGTRGNEQMRVLQGRCQAFGSILAFMRNSEQQLQNLAQQLEAAQGQAAQVVRPDGKVVPEPMVGGISL